MDGAEIGVLQLLSQHEQLYVGITHQSYEKEFRGFLNGPEGRSLNAVVFFARNSMHGQSHESCEGSGVQVYLGTAMSAGVLDLMLTYCGTFEFGQVRRCRACTWTISCLCLVLKVPLQLLCCLLPSDYIRFRDDSH